MTFAKIVFRVAGIFGLIVLTPMYFLYDWIGRQDPPPLHHPQFYFGFVGVGLAWQIAFLVLSSDPVRYRPLMIPSMIEKATFVGACGVLHLTGQLNWAQAAPAFPDLLFLLLFFVAFVKTGAALEAQMDGATTMAA